MAVTSAAVLGVLYDIHGNLPALEAVLADAEGVGIDRWLLGGDFRDRTIAFGDSHQPFRRPGPTGTDLVNPGSVGMPLDGDRRAAWATRDRDFAFPRGDYDVERAATAFRALDPEIGEFFAERILRGSD